jgi:hypothetical protein
MLTRGASLDTLKYISYTFSTGTKRYYVAGRWSSQVNPEAMRAIARRDKGSRPILFDWINRFQAVWSDIEQCELTPREELFFVLFR